MGADLHVVQVSAEVTHSAYSGVQVGDGRISIRWW